VRKHTTMNPNFRHFRRPAVPAGPRAAGSTALEMRIIGITGTLGAGKGTVVEFLTRPPYGYRHYSARSLLNEIIAERGLPPGRDSMRSVANGMRCVVDDWVGRLAWGICATVVGESCVCA
jgi:hypothetical protein